MNNAHERWKDYTRLRDAALDGIATPQEVGELEQLVLGCEEMKRDYAEHVHQIAALEWGVLDQSVRAEDGATTALSAIPPELVRDRTSDHGKKVLGVFAFVASLAATILLTLALSGVEGQSEDGFAMITSTERCQWGESSLPTTEQRMLGAGRMRLNSGIATVRFPLVNVTFEGPADFEIINEKSCRLHAGRACASVEPGGEGFEVRTPTAVLIDRGTVFGVNVMPSGTSDLQVFSGQVDVDHHSTGRKVSVTTEQSLRLSASTLGSIREVVEPTFQSASDLPSLPFRSIQISTAIGDGADCYVSPQPLPPKSCSHTALLIKRPPEIEDWGSEWQRKGFLRFDLSLIADATLHDAELILHGVATHIGFATLMPDATFRVYGIQDESQDHWAEDEMTWSTSPASMGEKLDLDPTRSVLLGTFVVEQSNPTGRFRVGGERLWEFLSADTNGVVTLAIVAETVGEGAAYVHGFASKRHPELPAPTLRLRVE